MNSNTWLHSQVAGSVNHHYYCLSVDLWVWVFPKGHSGAFSLYTCPPAPIPSHLTQPLCGFIPKNKGVVSPTQISPLSVDMYVQLLSSP